MSSRRSIWGERSGIAALELALIFPLFLTILLCTADLGLAYREKLKVSAAVTSAAYYAFRNGQDLSTATADTLVASTRAIISTSVGPSEDLSVSISINGQAGTALASQYACVSGNPPVYAGTGATRGTCAGDIDSGKFMTISVVSNVTPLFVSSGLFGSFFEIREQVTVRLV